MVIMTIVAEDGRLLLGFSPQASEALLEELKEFKSFEYDESVNSSLMQNQIDAMITALFKSAKSH